MTRQSQLLNSLSTLVMVYTLLYLRIVPLPTFITPKIQDEIIPVLPFNILVTLGSYCLFELGRGIMTFGECNEAQKELMRDIDEARTELKKQGISID
ncbi:BQ2448_5337 [Microbotryum intermedium]|uniref:Dolichol-phosphate mannosyltransferase subunit 3 n=1 Tax=Microbotryum intermedium TaxID=269621 RepID=A0A238F9H5_9BASI|nr:BQ2448_5337 [Microbotryum intermedium]